MQEHKPSRWQAKLKEHLLRVWKPIERKLRPKHAEPFQLRADLGCDDLSFSLYQSLGQRLAPGHRLAVYQNGAVFDALASEIERAESSIHIVIYIWEEGRASERIVQGLTRRAAEGVACRVLVDAFGSPDFDDALRPVLERAGCEVRTFRPLPGKQKLARNHRKIAIFDGRRAITGGFGIRDDWLGDGVHQDSWRESSVAFAGPAATEAQLAFAEHWQEAGGDLLPAQAFPEPASEGPASAAFVSSTGAALTRAERLTQLLIAHARRRVWISNAYLVPSRGIIGLLCEKASRGVDVRILTPGKRSDSKTSWGLQKLEHRTLIEHGARVWEYLPSMMHAKAMLVDEDVVLIGSINLEPLSLTLLEEASLVAQDREAAEQLARAFVEDCARSEELSGTRWRRRRHAASRKI